MSGNIPLSTEILDLISAAVSQTVRQTREALEADNPLQTSKDYFKITEKLLYNYPALKRLVADKAAYISEANRERSKSIVKMNPNSSWKSREDIQEEIERDKENAYDQTLYDFQRVEQVIKLHEDRKEFIIIRMYYFGEDLAESGRHNGERCTFEDISADTGRDEKTLRRWRNNIVNDMSVCLFGIEAAIYCGTKRQT